MSLTSNHWTFIKVVTIGGFCMAMAYGVFKGGISERVTAVEKTVVGHSTKIEKLTEHATRSETNMKWMQKTVENYNVQQTAVLDAIEGLKK